MEIFREEKDYIVFLHYLRIIFTPFEILESEVLETLTEESPDSRRAKNLKHALYQAVRLKICENVELLSFCLMPNHFHLLIFQKVKNGIEMLMRRLATSFSTYFAQKYNHVGSVFCRPYKASWLSYNPQLQALSVARYIENNPFSNLSKKSSSIMTSYPYSSLRYYSSPSNKPTPVWLKTNRLNDAFLQIKARPNGIFEDMLAKKDTLANFLSSDELFDLEDLRLSYLNDLS